MLYYSVLTLMFCVLMKWVVRLLLDFDVFLTVHHSIDFFKLPT